MEQKKRRKNRKKRRLRSAMTGIGILYAGAMLWHMNKPLPPGLAFKGERRRADEVSFLTDLTYMKNGERRQETAIFDAICRLIQEAEEFIVLDVFLFGHYGKHRDGEPKIAQRLMEDLLRKMEESPEIRICLLTDPISSGYGSYEPPEVAQLRSAGAETVYVSLDRLRDSIPLFSGLYRLIPLADDRKGKGWLPNPLDKNAPDFTLSSYLSMFNIRADHRKTVVSEKEAIVSSANPHDPSGLNCNVAFRLGGPVLCDILEAEEAVSLFSGGPRLPRPSSLTADRDSPYIVQYLTEKEIVKAVLPDLASAGKGDEVWLGMLFLSDAKVLRAIQSAAERGAEVRLILDPNRVAFGHDSNGLPNRPVAEKLIERTDGKVQIRWYNIPTGEFHTKLLAVRAGDRMVITGGSANFTERSLRNHNAESVLRIESASGSPLAEDVLAYFRRLWTNDGADFTLDWSAYEDELSPVHTAVYNIQKALRITTF
ncbi:phospholipase D-like domain-containing protein [Indiicoccus explosivorum]|uniref:phospholipase D-like domain-containing protein n=1 Tax=Indiicoccus explosivorum TaxID=1917864 RepID=UPI00138FE2B7|nr:phospholipase D-like domain-containing protein [Indiicoccus explosivorum]